MKSAYCAAISVIAMFAAGCAYKPVLHSAPAAEQAGGLVYALPKAQFQLDALRKAVTVDDIATAQKTADAAAAALSAANKTVTDAKSLLTTAQANVAALKDSDPPALKDKLEAERVLATVLLRARVAEAEVAKIQSKEAAKRLEQVTANVGKMEQTVTLKALPAAPDHQHRYAIVFDPSVVRDDNVKLTVANGLLNSTTSESTGQAGALLVNLASSLAGGTSPKRTLSTGIEKPTSTCEPFSLSRTFDPTDSKDVAAVALALETKSQNALKLIYNAQNPPGNAKYTKLPGIAYRAPRVITVEIEAQSSIACKFQTQPAHASLSATVPDSSETYYLPVEAGSFTKSKVDYVFKDGMPVTFSNDRPSQAVAVARLPIDVLKAIVEVPASIVKLRVDYNSQANSLTETEIKNLKAQIDLLNAQKELDAARAGE